MTKKFKDVCHPECQNKLTVELTTSEAVAVVQACLIRMGAEQRMTPRFNFLSSAVSKIDTILTAKGLQQ